MRSTSTGVCWRWTSVWLQPTRSASPSWWRPRKEGEERASGRWTTPRSFPISSDRWVPIESWMEVGRSHRIIDCHSKMCFCLHSVSRCSWCQCACMRVCLHVYMFVCMQIWQVSILPYIHTCICTFIDVYLFIMVEYDDRMKIATNLTVTLEFTWVVT